MNGEGEAKNSCALSFSQTGPHDLSAPFFKLCDLVSSWLQYFSTSLTLRMWTQFNFVHEKNGALSFLCGKAELVETLNDVSIALWSFGGFIAICMCMTLVALALACIVVLVILYASPSVRLKKRLRKIRKVRHVQVRRSYPRSKKCLFFLFLLTVDLRIVCEMGSEVFFPTWMSTIMVALAWFCIVAFVIRLASPSVQTHKRLDKTCKVDKGQACKSLPRIRKCFFFLFLFATQLCTVIAGGSELDHHDSSGNWANFAAEGMVPSIAPQGILQRLIYVHWAHGPLQAFPVEIGIPRWKDRSLIADFLGLRVANSLWENFAIHTVFPMPRLDQPFDSHYLLELPGDKEWRESMVLVQAHLAAQQTKTIQRVISLPWQITREVLLEELGLGTSCANPRNFCMVTILGEIWRSQFRDAKIIPDGTLISIIGDFAEDVACIDRAQQDGVTGGLIRTQQDSFGINDDDFSSLMQFGSYSSTDVQAHRRVVDQVFRILHDRRSFLGLSFWRPTRFSVWKIGFGEISSRIEVRVGVDYSISSWTTHVVSEIGEARHDDWNFHLVLPLPSAIRGTANKVNLIAQQTRELDGPKTLLADIWFSDFPERLVLQYVDYDTLIQILHSAFPYRVITEAELQWETPEGILSLRSLEQVALPQAVFVDILIGDPACENGYTSDVEDSTSLVQTFLNLSGELCEDVGQERIEEIAVYFARQREFEQPLIMHALDTTRIYGEAAIFNVLSAENRHSTRIRVTQFGLDQMHIGIRDAVWHFDDADNLGSLFLLIRETWWDFLAQGDELFVCYIYPQPTLTNGDLNLLVDVAPFRGGTPILFQEASLTDTFDYVATYTTHRNQGRMSLQIAFDALMLHDFCAIAECRVSFHTTELLDVQEVNTFPGQMWSVVADHSFDSTSIFEESSELESAEQDDEAYFMQIGGLGIFFDYDFLQNMRLFDRPGYRVAFWFLSVGASRWRCVNPTILEVNSLFGADFGWHQIFPEIRPTLDHYFTVVTPLPHSPGVLVMQHAIIYQFSVFDYVPLLVTVESDSYRSRDAWLVETTASEITVLDLFNLAFPQHRCNFEAFCIARKGGDEFDIQAVLTVEAGNHVILLHITPEPNEDEPSTASDFSSNPSDCLPGDGYDSDWSNEDDVASLLLLHSHREDAFQQGHRDSWSKGELAGMAFGISICPLLGGNENLVNVVPYKMQQALIVFHRLCPPGNTFKVFHLIHDWSTLDDVVQHDDFAVVFDWTPSSQNEPLRIRLESLLPQPEDSLQTKSSTVTLPELGPLFDLLCHSYQLHWPCNDVVEDNLPLSSLGYFEALRQIPPQNAKRVEIYTDGSFFAEQEIGGWAFVVIGYGLDEVPFAIHCAWGPMVSESLQEGWCGASKVGSRESEVEALIYALAWRIGAALDIPVHFLFDCNAAGFMASGIWGLKPSSKHDRVLRALAQLSQTLHPGRDKYDHVPGHRGVHGNEISDVLARLGAWQEANIGAQPLNLFSFIHNEPMEIEWLWLWAQQIEPHICFPSFRNNEMTFRPCFTAITTEEVFPAIPALQDCASRTDTTKFELGILTYNVCSLKDGLREELLSNHLYLREQLVSHGYHIAAFQETRSRQEGIFTSDTHVRCVSKANKGAGGTELWFLRFQPGTRKALICTSDIVVVNNNEEFLAVKVRFANNFLFVISGHCPQSGRSDEDIDAWWEALRDTLKMNHEPRFQTVLCIDANAHFSYEVPPCIGDAGLEKKTNRSARCFSALLQDFDLFLPSTFSECHSGEHVTWRRSLKMEGARCDYIAIPQGWAKLPISSFLASTVDAGATTFDHTAVGLWVKLLCQKRKPVRKPTFDRDAIRHVTQDQLYELSISFPLISWEENVHSHAMKHTRWLSEWLTKTFPAPVSSPKRSYISAECWEIRRQRLQAHRRLRRGRDCISRYYASTTLLAWRHSMTLGEAHDLCWHFLFLLLRQDRLLLSHIRELKSALRSHLRSDRTQFLTDIATEAVQAPAEKFFKILRRAGVVSRKFRTGPQPLPKLLLESGELAQTTEELVERWRSFFAQQEDGVVVSPDFLASQCQQCIDPIEVNWNEIPTLTQYEGAMRRMKSGKALFWDGLPGELFRFCAPTLGRICYPLFLKQCATEEEPLLFRGGRLTPLFKGKGARDQCSSYRSIFISPVLGKIHHRLFREQLAQYFEPYSLPMQLGGRPHKSVSQASHGLQLALADASQRGLSTAVIFVDIANAFYKAMRQHILPTPSDKRTVRELFHMLRLDDDAFGDFERYMICQTAFQDAEVPAHLENLLAQGLNTTWYGMDQSRIEARRLLC